MEQSEIHDGLRIDSMRDIAANKLMALLDRFEPKDFVDLYFLLQQTTLGAIRRDSEKKFGVQIDPVFLGAELAKVRRIAALPRMIKPLSLADLRIFFSETAQKLASEVIR